MPGGAISGNRQVLRTVTFTPVTTTRIRVWSPGPHGYSRITEVEAYESRSAPAPPPPDVRRVNVAAGQCRRHRHCVVDLRAAASAPAGAINGDRKGTNWGAGGGWNDATAASFPDWLQVDFAGARTINEIRVFTVQDNYAAPSSPPPR